MKIAFPDFEWLPWKFENDPVGIWSIEAHRHWYLRWLGGTLKLKTEAQWMSLTAEQLRKNCGNGILAKFAVGNWATIRFAPYHGCHERVASSAICLIAFGARRVLRDLRDRIGTFFYIDASVSFVYLMEILGGVLFGAAFLLVAKRQGNNQLIPVAAGVFAITLVTLGFFGWIFRDAKKSSEALRQKRRPPKDTDSETDDNSSNVVELPRNPPWMG